MADTNSLHAAPAVTEGDGINYRGIVWFVVILAGTTLACQLMMWGLFDLFQAQANRQDVARAPLAEPAGQPPAPPVLLTDEPANLEQFRAEEDRLLGTYGVIDRDHGVYRIPIERARELMLAQGFAPQAATPGAAVKKSK